MSRGGATGPERFRRFLRPGLLASALCVLVVFPCSIAAAQELSDSGVFDSKAELAVRNISDRTPVRLPPGSKVLRAQTDEPSFTGDFSGHFVADVPGRAVDNSPELRRSERVSPAGAPREPGRTPRPP